MLKNISRFVQIIFFLAIVLLGVLIGIENKNYIDLKIFNFIIPNLNVGVFILVGFILGIVVAYLYQFFKK